MPSHTTGLTADPDGWHGPRRQRRATMALLVQVANMEVDQEAQAL